MTIHALNELNCIGANDEKLLDEDDEDEDFGGVDAGDVSLSIQDLQTQARKEAGIIYTGTKRKATYNDSNVQVIEKSPQSSNSTNIVLTQEQFRQLISTAVSANSTDITVAVI